MQTVLRSRSSFLIRAFWTACFPLAASLGPVAAETAAPLCNVPPELASIEQPLVRVARRLTFGEAITVVAIGSSSTVGAGASSPATSYPSRLETELKRRYPKIAIRVL